MWVMLFLFFIPLTAFYIGLICMSTIYFHMGIMRLSTGKREQNSIKKRGGAFSVLVALLMVVIGTYGYFQYIWLW